MSKMGDDLRADGLGELAALGSNPFRTDYDAQEGYQLIETCLRELPALYYVVNQTVNYILSDDLEFEEEKDTEIYETFISSANIKDEINSNVLRRAMFNVLIYGHTGLRGLSKTDGLIEYAYNRYGRVMMDAKNYGGIKRPLAYIVSNDALLGSYHRSGEITEDLDVSDIRDFNFDIATRHLTLDEYGEVTQINVFKDIVSEDQEKTLIPTDQFANVILGNNAHYRKNSPLLKSQGPLQLLLVLYKRLKYDIEYNGLGTLAFKIQNNRLKRLATENGMDDATMFKGGSSTIEKENRAVEHRAKEILDQIKNASHNDSFVYGDVFESFEQLKRDTRATELLSIVERYAMEMITSAMGISAELIGTSSKSVSLGRSSVMQNEMRNSLIPLRHSIYRQIEPLLRNLLGVGNIKYNIPDYLQPSSGDSDIKIANVYKILADSGEPELATQYIKEKLFNG